MNHDTDVHAECRAEIYRLKANVTELRSALYLVTTLRQVGGMLPGVKELIDSILETVDEALKETKQ